MSRNPIVAIWLAGVLAAVLAYTVGPEHLLTTLAAAADRGLALVTAELQILSLRALTVLHAAAVGLFVTFVGLSLLAIRQGFKARVALVLVSSIFVWLVWSAEDAPSNPRWLAAFAIAAVGTLVMTNRVTGKGRS